jgi:CubicO group peptidase (beta-lactamase class C family)
MKRLPIVLALGLLMLTAGPSAAPPQQAATDTEIASRADALMTGLFMSGRFNGTVLLARNGKVVFEKGYGMANFEWDIPNSPSTKFRLGSITKQFTSMAIMQLSERGLLNVQDPIGKYLPDYPKPVADRVTIHHLLTHSSGIPSFTGLPSYEPNMPMKVTVAQMIDRFKNLPLEFEPGSTFKYDNSGYFLLGAIIEKVSGKPYDAFLQENIFKPLGMRDTGYDWSSVVLKNRASGYTRGPAGLDNAPYLDMGQPYAAGSLYSTVDDLLIWDQALYTEKLVKSASLDQIFHPWIAAGPMGQYGYGWGVSVVKGHRNIAHGGGINGFNTYISRFPDDHAVFIWLRNVIAPASPTMNQDLAAILLGEKGEGR